MWEFTRTKFRYVVPSISTIAQKLVIPKRMKDFRHLSVRGGRPTKDKFFFGSFGSKEAICVFFVFMCGGGWGFKIGIPARKQKKRDESDCYHNRKDAVP